jgi:hypothetical protein
LYHFPSHFLCSAARAFLLLLDLTTAKFAHSLVYMHTLFPQCGTLLPRHAHSWLFFKLETSCQYLTSSKRLPVCKS